jgi:uncharacterized protein YgiM (DUF1202 family)
MRKIIYGLIAVILLVPVLGTWSPVRVVEANPGTQWNAQYFNNQQLSGEPVLTRTDDQINFNWGEGSPGEGVPVDNFSARWTKKLFFPSTGTWTFKAGVDDGVRMWIDDLIIIDKWAGSSTGFAVYEVGVDQLTAGTHTLKVEYFEASGIARIEVSWSGPGGAQTQPADSNTPTSVGDVADWTGKYYNNMDVSGNPALERKDYKVDFDWGDGSPNKNKIQSDGFSVRWTAVVQFDQSGWWRFIAGADDGIRVWVDDTLIINEWDDPDGVYTEFAADLYELTAGAHTLRVEYFDAAGGARVKFYWQKRELPQEEPAADGTGGGGAAAPAPLPTIPVWAAVTADNVNVRTGPGLGYPTFARVFYPDDYRVQGGVPDLSWILIDLGDGVSGWVSNEWVYLYSSNDELNKDTTGGGQPDFVDIIPRVDIEVAPPASVPEDARPTVTVRGRATDVLNLRDGPSIYAARVIGSIPQNTILVIEARSGNGGWYLVNWDGQLRGWVSAEFVALIEGRVNDLVVSAEVVPAPPEGTVFVPETDAGEPVTVRGQASSNLRVRDAASVRGQEIAILNTNAEFVVLGRNTTGAWYLIDANGLVGWVYSPYVTLIEGRVTDLPIR